MTLPLIPLLEIMYDKQGDELAAAQSENIRRLYTYIVNMQESFANSAGEAIDPSLGQGGDAALTIVDVPTSISYTPGSSLSVDGVLYGHIDIVFTKPARGVNIVVQYREQGVTNFKTSYGSASPYRLTNLLVGTVYEVQLAGQAANGSVGPYSTLTAVTIPTTPLDTTAPTSLTATPTFQQVVLTWVAPAGGTILEYEVQIADDAGFTVNVELYNVDGIYYIYDAGAIAVTKFFRVRTVDRGGSVTAFSSAVSATTLNVADRSLTFTKMATNYAEIYAYDVAATVTISGTGIGNKVQVTAFDTNGNARLSTPDHTNDHIVVSGDGIYHVMCTASLSSGSGAPFRLGMAIYINNGATLFENLHVHTSFVGGGGDDISMSLTGLASLEDGDTVEAWAYNETNTTNVVVDDINLAIIRIDDT